MFKPEKSKFHLISEGDSILIIGGDERIKTYSWPPNVKVFTKGQADRVINSIRTGRADHVIFLTRWLSHADFEKIWKFKSNNKQTGDIHFHTWRQGLGELQKAIDKLKSQGHLEETQEEADVIPLFQGEEMVKKEKPNFQGLTGRIRGIFTEDPTEEWTISQLVKFLDLDLTKETRSQIQKTVSGLNKKGIIYKSHEGLTGLGARKDPPRYKLKSGVREGHKKDKKTLVKQTKEDPSPEYVLIHENGNVEICLSKLDAESRLSEIDGNVKIHKLGKEVKLRIVQRYVLEEE